MADALEAAPDGGGLPRRTLHEFDVVVTAKSVACDGRVIPAGSTGMIVDVCNTDGYFEVEFMSPFHCVATLNVSQIARA
jgi:hypothetical protein